MIEWKKYDKNGPPVIDKEYLVLQGGTIQVATLEKWVSVDGLVWFGSYEGIIFDKVTHYAEINLPKESE